MNKLKRLINRLVSDYKEIPFSELELDTIVNGEEWSSDHEVMASILSFKNPEIFVDPNLFAQVCLGLSNIAPDFLEFEFPTPEMIGLFFRTYEEIKKCFPEVKEQLIDEDVRQFIGVCCAEDGMFFLEETLKEFQSNLEDVLKECYNVNIPKEDITKCKLLWVKYYKTPLDEVPEDTTELIQVKKNYVIRNYLNDIFV